MNFIKWLLISMSIAGISGTLGFVAMMSFINVGETKPYIIEEPVVQLEAFNSPCTTCVYIDKTASVNSQNNPILRVSIYRNNELINTFKTVSGRASTQELDRNVAGNDSPSPNGEYIIETEVLEWPEWVVKLYPDTKGYHPETGGVFLPYSPLFKTERTALGFHVDPSWGKDNGEDGTSACNGFKTIEEYKEFTNTITENNITKLLINYE